jgi:hypothetical protein
VIIRREAIKAALAATTLDDSRYTLHAIQVQPDGRLIATDGHIAVVVTDADPFSDADYPTNPEKGLPPWKGNPDKPVLLPAETAKQLIAATPKKTPIPILTAVQLSVNGAEGGCRFSATDLVAVQTATIAPEDANGIFPDVSRVMPKASRPSLSVGLGVPVLESLLKAAKAIGAVAMRIDLPTEPQYQGSNGKDADGNRRGDGQVIAALRVTMQGRSRKGEAADAATLTIEAAAMPCRV